MRPPTEITSSVMHAWAFKRFLLGDALTLLAMMVGQVALPWWITLHNGVHDLAIYATVSAAVACLAIPAMAPIGDRHDKRRLIQLGLAVYLLSAILMATVVSRGTYDIRVLSALEAIAIVGMALVSPLTSVLATELLPSPELLRGMQRQKLCQSVGQLAGPMLGGIALAIAGAALALWVQVGLAALAVGLIRSLPSAAATTQLMPHPIRPWLTELTAGVRAKWRITLERNWTIISFMVGIFLMPALGMLLPLQVHALGLSGGWLGACETAVSTGLLAGAALGANERLVARLGRYRLRLAAMTLLGPALILVGHSRSPWQLATALGIAGLMNSMVVMMGYSRRIIATPKNFRTRMSAVNIMLTQLAAIVGPAFAGAGLLRWSIATVYMALGIAVLVCSLGYLLTPDFRLFMQLHEDDVDGWYGRRYPLAFVQKPTRQDPCSG